MIKLQDTLASKVKEWMEVKAERNRLEKKEKELNDLLKNAVKAAHGANGINDLTHPCQVGGVALHLEPVAAVYGAQITQEMVGQTPLTRRDYVVLKATPI